MSNFPNSLDDDASIPFVIDTVGHIDTTNAIRDAVFAIETEIGIGASGVTGSISNRLNVSFEIDGTLKPSVITALGLVTLPITNTQISPTAQISESKLDLDYATTDLYNLIVNQNIILNNNTSFIQDTGSKIEPHLAGVTYRHFLDHIDVSSESSEFFRDKNSNLRDNSNLYNLLYGINSDYVAHQRSDGTSSPITAPPTDYGHFAAGIYLNTSNFTFVPQTAINLQQFCQFIDNSNIFILGTRIQTLYSNGIPRTGRSTALTSAGDRGQAIVPYTSATTYLLNGNASTPVDNIDNGDDIVEFNPIASSMTDSSFDAKFALVKIGDILTVNYGSFIVPNVIKEKKLITSGGNKRYVVRVNNKNILAGAFTAKIDKPLFNVNKQGVLSLAQANTPTDDLPSLIIGNSRGAQVLGVNFNPDHIDNSHYNLWLVLYPDGNPASSVIDLPPIDISGNAGLTPGRYTLDTVVETTNNAFRAAGYNYRFIAYSNAGEFGIMLADSYNNASFSIVSGILASNGLYDNSLSNTVYSANVVGTPGFSNSDALGFGPSKANLASPPYAATYSTSDLAQTPMKMFVPLSRNNYYVNGIEREKFNLEPHQILDAYGDGYWEGIILSKTSIPGSRLEVTYKVNYNLSQSKLQIGKTLVVLAQTGGSIVDSGRFFIKDVQFDDCACDGYEAYTYITVYDAIHTKGITPFSSAPVNTPVSLYFNSDSVGFNKENSSDFSPVIANFKRSFEIYMNQDGYSFSHERARLNLIGSNTTVNNVTVYSDTILSNLNLVRISPKLRGYAFSSIAKINIQVTEYNETTGLYSAYLCKYDGVSATNLGPVTVGKKGQVVRLYDESYVDYIDISFNFTDSISNIVSTRNIDVQLFPTLRLDEEVMLLGTCQINDNTKKIQYLIDERQFGNVSEKQLSTSALNYISAPQNLLNENGIIRGFDVATAFSGSAFNNLLVKGGVALVNGKIVSVNDEVVTIPIIRETLYPTFTTNIDRVKFYLCINDKGKFDFIPSTNFDIAGGEASTYNTANLDHNRMFWAKNPNNTSTPAYVLRSHYFYDLLNQKDVTVIAIIDMFITTSGPNYIVNTATSNIYDVRRFVSKGYGGLQYPLTLGENASFRTFDAVNNFLKELINMKSFSYNNNFSKEVLVKSLINVSGKTFNFNDKVKFTGDGGGFTTLTTPANLTNVELNNLSIQVPVATGFNLNSNTSIKNCVFEYSYDATADGSFTVGNLSNYAKACILTNTTTGVTKKNIEIVNNTFNFSTENHFSAVSMIVSNENSYHENINISNNKFNNSYSVVDDKKSVISIISVLTAGPTLNQGPRFVNLHIDNNICDKNQLIIVSAIKNVDDVVANMLVILGSISNNICGAICYHTKQDVITTATNTTITNKNAILHINNNICKLIYCGIDTGFLNFDTSAAVYFIIDNENVYSGSTNIIENACSWIQVGLKKPSSVTYDEPTLNIENNKLNAYVATYLDDYYDTGLTPINIGIVVNEIVGS